MLTPKQSVINAVLITYIEYSIMENYIGKMASFLPYTRPEPLLKVITFTNISCGTVCNSFENGNFQIVDCTGFSNVEFWYEVTPKKETLPTTTHFKNMRSFCATLYNLFDNVITLLVFIRQITVKMTRKLVETCRRLF